MSDYEEVRASYELSASEGVQAIVQAADERIAELEAELEKANRRKANTEWNALVRQSDENLARAEKAEAERDALQDGINKAVKIWIELPYPPPGQGTAEDVILADLAALASNAECWQT